MNEEKEVLDKIKKINDMLDDMLKNIIQVNNQLILQVTTLKYENENN